MGEISLWYWYVGPGKRDSIRRLVIESGWEGWRLSFRVSAEGGSSIRRLGSAFLLIGLLGAMVVLLLWMHLLVTVGFI